MAEEGAADSAALVQGLLTAAEACGADAGKLAREAQIPGWALSPGLPVMLPLRYARSVWELTEHALGTADVPLAMASRSARGRHGVLDYLFATAPTVRGGLAAVAEFLHLWTTNGRLRIENSDDRAAAWSYYWRVPQGGRAEGLASQFLVLSAMRGIQMATGRSVVPREVTFAHDPPRSHRALNEALGPAQPHFGAPMTTIAFRAGDLDQRPAMPVLPQRHRPVTVERRGDRSRRQHAQRPAAQNPGMEDSCRNTQRSTIVGIRSRCCHDLLNPANTTRDSTETRSRV